MRNKVVVIGSLNFDIIFQLPKMIVLGETMAAKEASLVSGGKGANQAVQCAKLGLETHMIGCVGQDSMGDFLLQTLNGYGVHTEYVRRANQCSGMSAALSVPDGQVCAALLRGANFSLQKEDIDRAENLLRETAMVVLQLEIPLDVVAYAVQKCGEWGCRVILNAAPAEALDAQSVSGCELVIVNEVEAEAFCGQRITDMETAKKHVASTAARYQNQWVFTLGELGAVACDGKHTAQVPSKKVNAVETTGAGDSFVGGLVYGLFNGMPLLEACRFATECSAITVGGIGAQDSMPYLEAVLANVEGGSV